MTTPQDREPEPPRWDAPPQPPAWDRPAGAAQGWGPPPGPAPSPYGAAGSPGYGPPPGVGGTEGKAVAALVLAVVSWVALPFVAAVVSLVLAGSAKRDIERSHGQLGGAGLVTAAKIVSWANIVLCLLVVAAFVLFFAVFATAGFS